MSAISSISSFQPLNYPQQSIGNMSSAALSQQQGSSPLENGAPMPEQTQLQDRLQDRSQSQLQIGQQEGAFRPGEQPGARSSMLESVPGQNPPGTETTNPASTTGPGRSDMSAGNNLTPTLQALTRATGPLETGQANPGAENIMSEGARDMNVNEQVRQNVTRLMDSYGSQSRGGDPSAFSSFSGRA
ncbi:hypothetical protein Thiowin_00689 [Thiorhodovibrio winogradskyi]|uniref:Uncharacterized protein n=1 Tax=Thiorhodovibrio winogradskyi TaxID=77007 RepID=A0ABZ0S5E7_9GAMM|nr:hypothetical protein [Thiorhodovibrio winogradskyi]